MENTSKHRIISKLRSGLVGSSKSTHPPIPKDLYQPIEQALDLEFAQHFIKNGGKFIYNDTLNEFIINLEQLIQQQDWQNLFCEDSALTGIFDRYDIKYTSSYSKQLPIHVSISTCQNLIAQTGSVIINNQAPNGRSASIRTHTQIIVASSNQIIPNLKTALSFDTKANINSMMSIVSGPSRTADIEKTLVMGAHGPKELFLFLIES